MNGRKPARYPMSMHALAPGAKPPNATAVRLTLAQNGGGEVELRESKAHRLKLHLSEPVGCRCMQHESVYRAGDLDLFPAGTSDKWQEDAPSRAFLVELEPWLLERTSQELEGPSGSVLFEPRFQFRDPAIEHLLKALHAAQETDFKTSLYMESLATAIAARLCTEHGLRGPRERGLALPVQRRVLDYIEAQLSEDLSLGELAQVAGLSTSHFKVLFKRSFGFPVHEFVVRRRVERARQLLARGAPSVAQVAFEVGFAHQSHMARAMKRVLGVTPAALRRP